MVARADFVKCRTVHSGNRGEIPQVIMAAPPRRTYTIDDIARAAHVSRRTVQHARRIEEAGLGDMVLNSIITSAQALRRIGISR